MKMLPLLLFSCLHAASQGLALENTRVKGSTRLYVGVMNSLVVKGKIVTAKADDALIHITNDTLYIKPGQPGDLTLFIETENGPVSYSFTSHYLPHPDLVINKHITIESLLSGSAFSISQDDPDRLYAHYRLVSFDLAIGDVTVPVELASPSDAARKALVNKRAYYKVYLNRYVLVNPVNGRRMTVRCHRELQL